MPFRWSVAAVAMFASGTVCAASAAYLLRRRGAVGRVGLAAALAGAAAWGLAYGVELGSVTLPAKAFWGTAKYVGVSALPPAWLVFALQYTGREHRITRRLLLALTVEPVVVLTLMIVPATSGFVRSYPPGPLAEYPVVTLGPGFWALLGYSALVVGFATGLLLLTLLHTSPAYRQQSRLLVGAIGLVFVANLLSNVGVGVFRQVDPTPIALALAGLLLVLGVFRFGLLDLVPVARATLVETMSDAVLVLDGYSRVVDLNPAALSVLGRSASAVIGRRVEQLLGGLALPGDLRPTRQELTLAHAGQDREYEAVLSGLGEARHGGRHGARRHPQQGGVPGGHLLVLRDITERKQAERRLEQLAHYDTVTGLPNRKLFADRLHQALARGRRTGVSLAVLFFDLDRFKVINDSLGHDAGDQTLVAVARRVQQCLRSEDTLARFGGDEFCVLLPEISHPEDAAIVADKILRALSRPVLVRGRDLDVTVSIGIAVWREDGSDPGLLLNRADAAMYAAKAKGRHRFEFSNPQLSRNAHTLLELERDLRRALDRRELLLQFQPLISLLTQELLGFEALVRWRHPTRGLLGPAQFIPLAEDLGIVGAIDAWVLGEACREVQRCAHQPYVTVNFSPTQQIVQELPVVVETALRTSGLEPGRLCLEVSERAVTDDAQPVIDQLVELKRLGVTVAIDDFGAGRTSLGQLRQLPLDMVKIDQGFVRPLPDEGRDAIVIAAIVGLAHALGLTVVAEGVERPEQVPLLRDLGCDVGQGFLFARPQEMSSLLAGDLLPRR